MPNVQVIPAKKPIVSAQAATSTAKRKVAAYARVSSDTEEQLNSYDAQVAYYTDYIKARADWEYVDIYTDEGISALNTKKREGFKRRIADALAGKIALIVTKSVSRFARNTVDSLSTIRLLKEKGTECFFEKENIWTFDGKGELLITIMSSLAQEESRSLSENVTWGKRKGMADGKVCLPWTRVLGYEKGEDGLPKIVPEQAEIIRRIYRLFMQGKSSAVIASTMEADGIISPTGKAKWNKTTVLNMLRNELYKGDICRQKTMTTNFLNKSVKKNEGELPMFYIENSHPPIIPPDEWDAVQIEIARRSGMGRPVSCNSPFSTKIKCGDCGGYFGRKVWGSNTQYRKYIWRCNERYRKGNKHDCKTAHTKEEEIAIRFVTAFNQLMSKRKTIIEDCQMAQQLLCNTSAIDTELAELELEAERLDALVRQAIIENTRQAVDQDEWNKRNGIYLARHADTMARIDELEARKKERLGKSKVLDIFIRDTLSQKEILTEFDENVWAVIIDQVVIQADGSMVFKFKNGTEITV